MGVESGKTHLNMRLTDPRLPELRYLTSKSKCAVKTTTLPNAKRKKRRENETAHWLVSD